MQKQGVPVISVDTKKKEMVGNFKNAGVLWTRNPVLVNDHDFRSDARGMATPYGIYDTRANQGSVFVGNSHDTSEFAAESIARWWRQEGRRRYAGLRDLLILCDSGGSNDYRRWAWKDELQKKLCDGLRLTVTVCHYPPGAAKWNPIEHRLFSAISRNWAGKPLESYDTILHYIRTTKTSKGLKVRATFLSGPYETGAKVSAARVKEMQITRHKTLPQWNYTLTPTKAN